MGELSSTANPAGEGLAVPRTLVDGVAWVDDETREYRTAFRSAGIIGSASALSLVIGLVRSKVLAVLLGPAGTGLMGLYSQLTGLVGAFSDFGISASGVRQIAEAAGTGDRTRVARIDRAVRRVAWLTGSLGMVLQLSLCWVFSQWTFGDSTHWRAIAFLAVIPLLRGLSGARTARIQGLRRIGDLAWQSVLGAVAGTVSGIALIWAFGFRGIVPQLIVVAGSSLALSSYFSRRAPLPRVDSTWRGSLGEAGPLVGLGVSLMLSSLAATAATYLVSAMVARQLGVGANGLFLAAWALSGLFANFVLNAMAADYYPRLTGAAREPARFGPMVNRQGEIALLIATPGIVATLAFAPVVIPLFYSGAYSGAYDVMRWLVLGVFLRLVSWPLGFILLAQGAARLFLATEVLHQIAYVGLVYALLGPNGLPGVGEAFALLCVGHSFVVFGVVALRYGFRYRRAYLPILAVCLGMTVGAFFLPGIALVWLRYTAGAFLSLLACLVCGAILKRLLRLGTAADVVRMVLHLAGLGTKVPRP